MQKQRNKYRSIPTLNKIFDKHFNIFNAFAHSRCHQNFSSPWFRIIHIHVSLLYSLFVLFIALFVFCFFVRLFVWLSSFCYFCISCMIYLAWSILCVILLVFIPLCWHFFLNFHSLLLYSFSIHWLYLYFYYFCYDRSSLFLLYFYWIQYSLKNWHLSI